MKFLNSFILILLTCLTSCKSEVQEKEPTQSSEAIKIAIDQNNTETKIHADSLVKIKTINQLRSELKFKRDYSCSRILASPYEKRNLEKKTTYDFYPFSINSIIDINVEGFNQLLSKGEKTGYCCCPERNILLHFLDKTYNYKTYYVDTISNKDNVRIYQSSYQYSYIIDKSEWNKFLNEQNELSFIKYFVTDHKKAKEIHSYTIENNIPIITSNSTSNMWMNYEGDFEFTVSAVGEKITEQEIYKNIYMQYPTDDYKVETIGRYQMCGSYDGNDCYEEYVIRIFSNKDFHNKFKTYLPRSYFDKAIGTFIAVGNVEELNKMENIYPNDD